MVERGGLENRCGGDSTQGSNPCLSANYPKLFYENQWFERLLRDLDYHSVYHWGEEALTGRCVEPPIQNANMLRVTALQLSLQTITPPRPTARCTLDWIGSYWAGR